MTALNAIHQLLAFILELAMLGAVGVWGFRSGATAPMNWLLGIGLPLLLALCWGIWMAPKSTARIGMPYRAAVILLLFEVAAYLLYRAGQPNLAVAFALLSVLSTVLTFVFPE